MLDKDKLPFDGFHDECGVFGIYGSSDAAAHTALGLHALQHRGQESAGIVSYDNGLFCSHKATGHVGDIFNSPDIIQQLSGDCAIGHVRYSTTTDKHTRNIQPIFAEFVFGGLAIAHNGNLTNSATLRKELISSGSIFQSTMDTEIFIHLLATSRKEKVADRIIETLQKVQGAYSLVALSQKKLIGARDPYGVRPLCLGVLGNAYIFASETCALDIIGAQFVRDVEPGEIVIIDKEGIHSLKPFEKKPQRFCVFEYIYFSRPDSIVEGKDVYGVRKHIGHQLAKEKPIKADVIVPVPDSGVAAALGYAEESGIPFELGIIRNHYVGRTFIEPSDKVRHLGVKLKHNPNSSVLKGKEVILVDDSIVRGTTSKKIISMVRDAGATKIHMRIASPPTTNPCFYGVDTPDKDKLIASQHNNEEIAKIIGADSLEFISVDGLYQAAINAKRDPSQPQFCDACFTGEYPIKVLDKNSSTSLFTETKRRK